MFNLSQSVRIFVATKPVDMRLGFNGLSGLVRTVLQQDLLSGHLFLFRSKRGNFIKMLWWDVDGVCGNLKVGHFFGNGSRKVVHFARVF